MNINQLNRVIEGTIADNSGHTDFRGTLDEAVDMIVENCKKQAKWAYINGKPFIFEKFDNTERKAVYDLLDAEDNPYFTITPALQGGENGPVC